MKLENFCSAIVYTMKYGDPFFLVEDKGEGYLAVPKVEIYVAQNDKETDRT